MARSWERAKQRSGRSTPCGIGRYSETGLRSAAEAALLLETGDCVRLAVDQEVNALHAGVQPATRPLLPGQIVRVVVVHKLLDVVRRQVERHVVAPDLRRRGEPVQATPLTGAPQAGALKRLRAM